MVPSHFPSPQTRNHNGKGCFLEPGNFMEDFALCLYQINCDNYIGSDLTSDFMAEEDSRTSSFNEAGSSSRVLQEEEDNWLQLGLGLGQRENRHESSRGLVELELLPNRQIELANIRPPPFVLNLQRQNRPPFLGGFPAPRAVFRPPESQWAWNYPANVNVSGLYGRPLPENQRGLNFPAILPAKSGLRIVDTPQRTNSGVWFVLEANQNLEKDRVLPQIPRSYLRIKDGKMTVQVVMKYLAKKLGLGSESEVFLSLSLNVPKGVGYLSLYVNVSTVVGFSLSRISLVTHTSCISFDWAERTTFRDAMKAYRLT
ncbi:hypothetical protein AMTRI_Chr06g170670 [Amborella trichopoda]